MGDSTIDPFASFLNDFYEIYQLFKELFLEEKVLFCLMEREVKELENSTLPPKAAFLLLSLKKYLRQGQHLNALTLEQLAIAKGLCERASGKRKEISS